MNKSEVDGQNIILIYDGRFRKAWILNEAVEKLVCMNKPGADIISLMDKNTAELAFHTLEVITSEDSDPSELSDLMVHLRMQHDISNAAVENHEIALAVSGLFETISRPPQAAN